MLVLTIGHSTHPLEEFIQLLQAQAVTRVVDVRKIPRSRRNPQFNRETLPRSLNSAGISYIHLSGLGGLRRPRPDSPNTGWRTAAFQGFADYMQTLEFIDNFQTLLELARVGRVALMCAEALPWRCHRFLIADALAAQNIQVEHILSATRVETHSLTPWAKVNGASLTYPLQTASPPKVSGE